MTKVRNARTWRIWFKARQGVGILSKASRPDGEEKAWIQRPVCTASRATGAGTGIVSRRSLPVRPRPLGRAEERTQRARAVTRVRVEIHWTLRAWPTRGRLTTSFPRRRAFLEGVGASTRSVCSAGVLRRQRSKMFCSPRCLCTFRVSWILPLHPFTSRESCKRREPQFLLFRPSRKVELVSNMKVGCA